MGVGLRFGFVDAESEDGYTYRVRFEDRDNMVTPLLQRLVESAEGDKKNHPLKKGAHVACLVDEHGASGVILGAVYSEANKPDNRSSTKDRSTYSDGAVIEYDTASHKLKASLPGGGTVEITAPGGVSISGPLHVSGDIVGSGKVQASGNVQSGGDVTAGLVSLLGHHHIAPGGFSPAPTGPAL